MGLSSPFTLVGDGHFAITPHDSNNFTVNNRKVTAAVAVLSVGTVVVVSAQNEAVPWLINTVPFIIPLRAVRVNATGTTPGMTLIGMY